MRGLLGLLLLVAPLGALAASRFHERNHSGLLFLYAFDEGQVSPTPPSEVRDASGRYLMGNLTTSTTGAVSWSVARQGMSTPSGGGGARAVTQLSSEALLPLLTDEFTLEFFFSSPINPLSQRLLIAGFSNLSPGSALGSCDPSNVDIEGGWRLISFLNTVVQFVAVLTVDGVPTCVSATIGSVADTTRHLVARVRSGELSLRSHGSFTTITEVNPMFSSSVWAPRISPLSIATPHPDAGWRGVLYMVAMYDRFLSDEEIDANQALGPPNSLPWAPSAALALDEDTATTLN
jgi:hypothetical protein